MTSSRALGLAFVLLAACGPSHALQSSASEEAVSGACAVKPVPARSLFVSDPTTLAGFSLQGVMNQIVATGSTTGQTALGVYRQMLDTLNDASHAVTTGPHCDDHKNANGHATLNGFPQQFCPRQEGFLATTNPFAGGRNAFFALAAVNRFDLAPKGGANCGQYRIIFAKESGRSDVFDRMFLIFEAVLPNPAASPTNPHPGLDGCVPVAKFWDDLSNDASASSRGTKLASFYFSGLPGFEPVVKAAHYGFGGGLNTGQIRANMFMNVAPGNPVTGQEWELREFRLSQSCAGTACTLTAHNTVAQNNPFGPLFAGRDTQSLAFQKELIDQIPRLAARSIPEISMVISRAFDGPESDEQDPTNQDYFAQAQNNKAFLGQIQTKLTAMGRTDLTPQDILERATTQGCAGCHDISMARFLGDDLFFPATDGFVQFDERRLLSQALSDVFLPARAATLEGFLDAHCGGPPPPAVDDGATIGGSAVGAPN